jgi:hypothetical protein
MVKKESKRNERLSEPRWTAEEVAIVEKKAKKMGLSISSYLRKIHYRRHWLTALILKDQ